MKLWKLIVALLFPALGWSQAYYQNQAFTTSYINGTRVVSVVPGAKVEVCTMPTGACVQVPVYSDAGLSAPIAQPFAVDGYGNFGFWVTAGTYAYRILNAQGIQQQSFPFTIGNGSGGGTLSGDTTGPAGGNTVVKVNGAPIPAAVPVVATDASSHIVPAAVQGNGSKVQLANGSTTVNHCPKYDGAGNLIDSGAGCGGGVPSVNSITGAVNIVAGANVTVTPSGSNVTIASTAGGITPTGVTPGPYTNLNATVGADGRITAAANGSGGVGGGGSPAGATLAMQYNNAGVFGGAGVSTDATHNNLNVPGVLSTGPTDMLANGVRAGQTLRCGEASAPYDIGGYSGFTCLSFPYFNDWSPGWDYGSPGTLSDNTWFGSNTIEAFPSSYSGGIHSFISEGGVHNGPGDLQVLDLYDMVKPAMIAGSDEGMHKIRAATIEEWEYLGTVANGGVGTTAINTTCTDHCGSTGLNSPLIDLNSVVSGTLSGVTTITVNGNESLHSGNTSFTVPVSTSGTLAADVDVPRIIANTTGELSAASKTVVLNTATALTTSTLIDVMGPAFQEVIRPTAVGPLAGGTQSITAIFHYSHTSGTQFCAGGVVGSYLESTATTIAGQKYMENVFCSPDANTIWFGHQEPNRLSAVLGNGPVNMYQGGEVVGVLDPMTGTPFGSYFAIMPNNAAWAAGDSVMNANDISASYALIFSADQINNPFASRIDHVDNWSGVGGGLNEFNGWQKFSNAVPYNNYAGLGGSLFAPYGLYMEGVERNGLAMQFAPVGSGGVDIGASGCAGVMVCAGSIAPGATDHNVHIFTMGDQLGAIDYDHDARQFKFLAAAGINTAATVSAQDMRDNHWLVIGDGGGSCTGYCPKPGIQFVNENFATSGRTGTYFGLAWNSDSAGYGNTDLCIADASTDTSDYARNCNRNLQLGNLVAGGNVSGATITANNGAVVINAPSNTGFANVNGYDYLGAQKFGFGYSGAGTSGASFIGGKFFLLGVNVPICITAWTGNPICGMQMNPADDSIVLSSPLTAPSLTVSGLTAGDCIQAGANGTLTSTSGPCGSGGGGGNTTSTALVTGNIPVANGPNSIIDSGISITNGGTAHGVSFPEGTIIPPVAGYDTLSADATSHSLLLSNNGAAASPICTVATGCGAGGLPLYNSSGTLQTSSHLVTGEVTIAGNTSVTLSGAAAFTSATSYSCVVSAPVITSGSISVPISYNSGSSFTINGDSAGSGFSGTMRYICVGN